MKLLITGAEGFIGSNLKLRLENMDGVEPLAFTANDSETRLHEFLRRCDGIFHLAGINRAENLNDFEDGNARFTRKICDLLMGIGRNPAIVFSSSIQADLDNPYGVTKRRAESILSHFSARSQSSVGIFRLKNVFGKWCRPNYNSVVATFCDSIAHDKPIEISDPNREIDLVYIDDVLTAFIETMNALIDGQHTSRNCETGAIEDRIPFFTLTLGDLAGRIQFFREMQLSLLVPDFSVAFNRQLYATYLSYLDSDQCKYDLQMFSDERGSLAEFIKSECFGQVFVSRTLPGVTRGNHYHHTKTEKFLVIAGEGVIRLRPIKAIEVTEIKVNGEKFQVVDIPPGYTHSITNIGDSVMITLFWASEIFNPDLPDTYYLEVDPKRNA